MFLCQFLPVNNSPPAYSQSSEVNESTDWFCRRCMTMIECVNEIGDRVGDVLRGWRNMFSIEELDAEQEADDAEMARSTLTKRSKRGREIKPPKVRSEFFISFFY